MSKGKAGWIGNGNRRKFEIRIRELGCCSKVLEGAGELVFGGK
jgi:hypothetical protein